MSFPRMSFRRLILALLVLATATAAAPAAAQPNVLASLTDYQHLDLDDSGDVSCGDVLRFALELGTTDDADDLHDVEVEVPIPANALVIPASIVATNPHDTVTLRGNTPIEVDFGYICATAGECGGRNLGARLEFDLRIRTPNDASILAVQGRVGGSNIPLTVLTDDPEQPLAVDETTIPYTPCPPPQLFATLADELVTDLDGDGLADPGDTLRYHASVGNTGSVEAAAPRFRAPIPAHSALLTGSILAPPGSATSTLGDLVIDLPVLAPGAVHDLAFDVLLDAPVPSGTTQIVAQGTASDTAAMSVLTDDPDTAQSPDPTVTPLDFDPELALLVQAQQPSAAAGQLARFDLTWSNLGRAAAHGVVITDTVPQHGRFDATASDPGWACADGAPAGANCTLALGTVGPGQAGTATFAVRIDPTLPAGVDATTNHASIADDGTAGPDPDLTNNSSQTTVGLDAAPDLVVDKLAPAAAPAPGPLSYQIELANLGTQDATGVELVEHVPDHTTFDATASSAGWSCPDGSPAGTPCTLSLGDLAAGDAGSLTFAVRIAASAPADGHLTNTVTLLDDGANGPDLDPGDNTDSEITEVLGPPDLLIHKTAPATTTPGSTLLFELTFANRGEQEATGVTLLETVPAPAIFDASASSTGWSCSDGDPPGTPCTLNLPSLAPEEVGDATFSVRLPATLAAGIDSLANRADIANDGSHGADPTPADNTSSTTTEIIAAPDLAVDKDDGDSLALPGGPLSYTLTVANLGTQDASDVLVTDVLPPGFLVDLDSSSAGWSCTPPTDSTPASCSLLLDQVAAGAAPTTLLLSGSVDAALPPEIAELINLATVQDDGANGEDLDPSNDVARETTPVERRPPPQAELAALLTDRVIEGAAAPGVAAAGAVLSYTAVVTNPGAEGATGVALLLPPDPHTQLRGDTITLTAGSATEHPDGTLEIALDTLAPGASLTLTFEVDVDPDLPSTLTHLTLQGTLTAANAPATLTDDPDTPTPLDPTLTPVETAGAPPSPEDIPTVSTLGLAALAVALLLLAALRLRRPRPEPQS